MIGVEALRVADSSIIPSLTNGNLNLPTIMIGEKGADHILGKPPLAPANAGYFAAENHEKRDVKPACQGHASDSSCAPLGSGEALGDGSPSARSGEISVARGCGFAGLAILCAALGLCMIRRSPSRSRRACCW